VHSVADMSAFRAGGQAPDEAVAVAFSHAGLAALGIVECEKFPFPTAFVSGMGSRLRADLLRDSPRTAWTWDDTGTDSRTKIHVLLAHWWQAGGPNSLPPIPPEAFECIQIHGCPGYFNEQGALIEAFGFRDGLSQPVIYGLRDDDDAAKAKAREQAGAFYADRVVAAGEFILGYRNEYDELSHVPDVKGWQDSGPHSHPEARFALNGSYLAVRQIEQHVDRFNAFLTGACGLPGQPTCEMLAAKLMGRFRGAEGTPVGWRTGDPLPGKAGGAKDTVPSCESHADAFRYHNDDAQGFGCPLGAHVRRANPRDAHGPDSRAGVLASKLHRLLRRGRPYRDASPGSEHQGLFFIACNADLERQFEFVHQRWLKNPRFAGLEGEDDPLLGGLGTAAQCSIPGLPSGQAVSLQSFTTTLGGGYFFLPGLRALQFIAQGGARPASAATAPPRHLDQASYPAG